MAVQFHPLPVTVFGNEAQPFIKRLNHELRDLFALEGVIFNPRTANRSDATIARREEIQVDISRISGQQESSTILDADTLDGLDSTQFLRSDASDTYTTGTLSFNASTTLNVAGAFQLAGSAVTSSAAELNKLDGAGATVTASNLDTLTDTSDADALHTHDTLGGIGSANFLRSDESDTGVGTYTLSNANPLILTDTTADITFGTGTGVQDLVFTGTATGAFGARVLIKNSDGATKTFIIAATNAAGGLSCDGNLNITSSGTLAATATSVCQFISAAGSVSFFQSADVPLSVNFGSSTRQQDITVAFSTSGNDGEFLWDESADYFTFSDDIHFPDNIGLVFGTGDDIALRFDTAALVLNDAAADIDFRMEGTGEANLFYLDAGNDRIGIGLAAPGNSLEVDTSTMKLKADSTNSNAFLGSQVFDTAEGQNNLGFGFRAGRYNHADSDGNTYIGALAGQGASGAAANSNNVGIGYSALRDITTGSDDLAIGQFAGVVMTTGIRNTAIGSLAMSACVDGGNNVAVGFFALSLLDSGDRNVCVGSGAGLNVTSAVDNVVLGHNALTYNQTGANNVSIGNNSGGATGASGNSCADNVFVGHQAGRGILTGIRNIFLGTYCARATTTGQENLVVGWNQDTSGATASGEINIWGTLFGGTGGGSIGITSGSNFYFEATSAAALGDTYIGYDGSTSLDCFVNNTEVWNATTTEVNFVVIPAFKNGIESRYYDVGDSNYTGFKAPALTGNQIYSLPTADGADGDVLTTNGSGALSWLSGASEKAWTFTSPAGSSGVFYAGGFYEFHSTSFTPAGGTNVGTANSSYAAHALVVLGAASTDMVVRVTGTSITDTGTRTAADTEDIDTSAGSTDDYYETAKKWIGAVSYTLQSGTGVTIDAGFAKYWDNNNTDFAVTGLEVTWLAGASDSAPDIELLHHTATGWTYSGGGGTPTTPTALASMNTDHSTESETVNGDPGAWKRTNLATNVDGASSEGTIWRITTTANKAFEIGNILMRITPQ